MFLNREGSRGATGEMPAEKKMEIFITFCLRAKWGFDTPSDWEIYINLNVGSND